MKMFFRDYALTWATLFVTSAATGAYTSLLVSPLDCSVWGRVAQVVIVSIVSGIIAGIKAAAREGK